MISNILHSIQIIIILIFNILLQAFFAELEVKKMHIYSTVAQIVNIINGQKKH